MDTSPRIMEDLPAAEYFKDPIFEELGERSLTASLASDLLREPPNNTALRLNGQLPRREQTPAMLEGSVYHSLVLKEAGHADNIVIIDGDYRKQNSRDLRDDAHKAGKLVIQRSKFEWITEAASVLQSNFSTILINGKSEVSAAWYDEEFKIWLRCRFDWLFDTDEPGWPRAIDNKFIDAIAGWENKSVSNYDLALRIALYGEGLQKVFGIDGRPIQGFLLQEKAPPYSACLKIVGPDHDAGRKVYEEGEKDLKRAKEIFANGIKKDEWPEQPQTSIFKAEDWAFRSAHNAHFEGETK